jgi:2-isopropylmalate synthase
VPESKLVLGKHSGRHALGKRAQEMGFELTKQELDSLYLRFTALADRKKGLMDEEIIALIHEGQQARKVAAD